MRPFVPGTPFPTDRFVGRRRELDELLSRIAHHGQSAAVIGEPRIGKTSLLEHLVSPAILAEIQPASPKRLLVAHVNAHSLVVDFDQARFWGDVLEQLEGSGAFDAMETPPGAAYRACKQKAFETRAMERLFKSLATAGFRLVVLIDEFDYLVDRCVVKHSEFFASLRALTIGAHRALALVVASRRSLAQLDELAREHVRSGSPYFNPIAEILLGPLSSEEVDELLRAAHDRFSHDDRRFIHDLSGGYPYLVQVAADALWKAYDGSNPDAAARRRAAGAALLRVASQTLDDIWGHWPPRMRYAFVSVAVEHLDAMGPHITWASSDGSSVGPVVDAASSPQELHALAEHGMIAANRNMPGGFGVRPIIFLVWSAVRLRSQAQSTRLWAHWIRQEGWDELLSPRRKQLWEGSLRERASVVRTEVELLLEANAALGNPNAAVDRPWTSPEPPLAASAGRPKRPLLLFYSYAEIDEPHRRQLDNHLAALKREGLLRTWWDQKVEPGHDYRTQIEANLARAHIVLLLVSADLLGAEGPWGEQLDRAMARHLRHQARVIPIRIRPADWGNLPHASLAALPSDGRAVIQWPNHDDAWVDVAAGIRRAVEEIEALVDG